MHAKGNGTVILNETYTVNGTYYFQKISFIGPTMEDGQLGPLGQLVPHHVVLGRDLAIAGASLKCSVLVRKRRQNCVRSYPVVETLRVRSCMRHGRSNAYGIMYFVSFENIRNLEWSCHGDKMYAIYLVRCNCVLTVVNNLG